MNNINVKGTGVISTKAYVETNHKSQYKAWVNSLPTKSNSIYTKSISATEWYSVEDAYYYPLKHIAERFYNGDERTTGLEVGRFSANYGLKGVYKVFLMIATPQALMRASKRIISVYFSNTEVKIDDVKKKSLVLSCTRVFTTNELFDYRTIGWCMRALELANCKNVKFDIVKPKYSKMFSVELSWS
ncbi:MAG: hypothetical protein DRI86_13860 [Bacteroidetes bacterium]|nr:MAG: hypothetical protein DRI86_13860 [Bacteroidota bacterium]